jgi:hypothetical protein
VLAELGAGAPTFREELERAPYRDTAAPFLDDACPAFGLELAILVQVVLE